MTREELLKIAKPILFNTEMVQAILEGRKSVTRRIIKPRYKEGEGGFQVCTNKDTGERWVEKVDEDGCGIFPDGSIRYVNPPYKLGDILYVRETFCEVPYEYEHIPIKNGHITVPKIAYRADSEIDYTGIWKPSIHMPKEFARIFLEVTDVRVERLLDMSIEDMIREGVKVSDITTNRGIIGYRVTNRFQELWDSTIKKKELDMYGMDANPWVWVIEFERVEVKNDRGGFNENKNKIL